MNASSIQSLAVAAALILSAGACVGVWLGQRPAGPSTAVMSDTDPAKPVNADNSSIPGSSASVEVSTKADSPKPLEPSVVFPNFQVTEDKAALEAEAFAVANRLMAMMPNEAKAIHVAAVCNSQFHKTAEAQKLWLKCIDLSPNTETYYLNVAANAIFRGETELALETLERAYARGIRSADISHHTALALTRLGEDERAVEVLKNALKESSALPAHWMLLGQSELKLNRLEDAQASLNKALDMGIRSRPLYVALLNTASRMGNKELMEKYKQIVAESSDQPTDDGKEQFRAISDREARRVLITVLGEACVVYRDMDRVEDAEHAALRLLAHEPNNYGTCLFLAELYAKRHQVADEVAARERMLEINPSDLMNRLQFARLLVDAGFSKRGESQLKAVIMLAPQQAIGYAAMAEFLVSEKQPARAQWYAEQALQRENSPGGRRLLARILRSQGNEAEAQKVESAGLQPVPPPSPNP